MTSFAGHFGALAALRLESCIHCGLCADACHFYVATEDPQYTPVRKAEAFKQVYRREFGPFAPLIRGLGLKRQVTADQLADWQHLLYDSCNLCGRCSLICPMGIDVAELIEEGRRAMFEAGLAAQELYDKAEHQVRTGQPESSDEPYRERLLVIGAEYGVNVPIDREAAEVLLCVSRTDIESYPKSVAALARVMEHLGTTATFRSEALVAENYGYYAGSRDWQRQISLRLIDAALACGANLLIVPECGHAYTALRWQAAELYGAPLPFEVRHITEFLAEQLTTGRLQLRPANDDSVTFHDPCQLVRKGGVQNAPRQLMEAMGIELREMALHRGFGFCCAGGGGVIDIERAAPLRHRAMEIKIREVDATGAATLLTSCADCRRSFAEAETHLQWDKSAQSLVELVAEHLL